jgi:uncharacterized membrane protein
MTDIKTPAPVAVAAVDSPALQTLKAEKKALWAELIKHEDPDTKEALEAKMNVWKKDGEIKAEIARLESEANAQKIAEQRNIRLQLNTAQLSAYAALLAEQANKKATPESIAALQTAFDTAKEAVDNELLAKYAKSAVAKKSSDGETKETSEAAEAKKTAILALYRAGKKHSEIETETGYPRSTVWHVINNAITKDGEPKLH